jgi:hypothetical protein
MKAGGMYIGCDFCAKGRGFAAEFVIVELPGG